MRYKRTRIKPPSWKSYFIVIKKGLRSLHLLCHRSVSRKDTPIAANLLYSSQCPGQGNYLTFTFDILSMVESNKDIISACDKEA